MSDPSAVIQTAQEAALRGASLVTSEFPGGKARIYTLSAPADALFPHIVLGASQLIGDASGCVDGSGFATTTHVYAREATLKASALKAMSLAAAVRKTLDAELTLPGHKIIDWSFETTRHLSDPDLLTAHSVVSQEYFTEPTA